MLRKLRKLKLEKIKAKLFEFLRQILIWISFSTANRALGGEAGHASKDQIIHIRHSGMFGKSEDLDLTRMYRIWATSDVLWRQGRYQESVNLRKICLTEVIKSQQITEEFTPPSFMSVGWTAAIGHLGYLGYFTLGQQLGLAPNNQRSVPVKSPKELANLRLIFQNRVNPIHYRHGYSILEHPSQWHQSERLQMIRTESDLIEIHKFTEDVFTNPGYDSKIHRLTLPEDYTQSAKSTLAQLGLPSDAWFVSLHVREKENKHDSRIANVLNYLPAISEITSRGGWVIRFGTGQMTPLPKMENVIDLCPENLLFNGLHLYLLGKARFVLVTMSGPMELAKSMGTPVLGTNTTSIARNMQSGPPGTLYIPKKWIHNGRKVSLSELLAGTEGYSENDLRDKFKLGYTIQENTPEEILAATVDMFSSSHEIGGTRSKVAEIRKANNAIAKGDIAPSFLSSTSKWFLDT